MKTKVFGAVLVALSALVLGAWFPHGAPTTPARVQKNLVSDYGATCNSITLERTVTIGAGSPNLAVAEDTFAAGDVGKTIFVNYNGTEAVDGGLVTTIQSFTDAKNVVLAANASTALSAKLTTIGFGANDTSAFLAFKADFQGSTPVTLTVPSNCSYRPTSGAGLLPFKGILNLIVQGTGSTTSSIINLAGATQNMLFGAAGQYQDNAHSLRTETANAGDSCVTIKTQPSITISGASPSFAPTSTFTASASGTTLTVTAVSSGTIVPGAIINNRAGNPGAFNTIQPYGTGGTTGVGGTGTYALSTTASFGSQSASTVPASYTASVDANGLMTVSSVEDGTLVAGMSVFDIGGAFSGTGGTTSAITTIKNQVSGSAGGAGTYQLDHSPTTAVASKKFQSGGFIRLTVNSTTGLSTGDTIFISGVTGQGGLPQRVNGLKWIKVIDGTTIELFQWVYDGAYTSGGVGGGDRTSLTPVGSVVFMTGWANQAYWSAPYGFPSNPHYFEYKTVASVTPGNYLSPGQVCFTTPLVNTYKSTWPQYNTGSLFEVDAGGPATLYLIDPTWNATHVYKDFALTNLTYQTTANARSITWENVRMDGIHCAIPTQNETYNWTNVDGATCNIETDKIVGTWNIVNSSVNKMTIQSSSIDLINLSGVTARQWLGSPKRLVINNGTFTCSTCVDPVTNSLAFGTAAYGATDEVICTNCALNSGFQIGYTSAIQRVDDPTHPWSMSGGVITIPNAYSWSGGANASETQTRGLVPNHYAVWLGSGGPGVTSKAGRIFKIVDVTQDLTNIYVHTSEAGGFPLGGTWAQNGLSVFSHPAPLLTVSGATGPASAVALNGCTSLPMYSCANYTYTGGATGGSTAGFAPTLWGEFDTFSFTTNTPTYAGALTWQISRFNNWQILLSDLTTANYGASPNGQAIINTKLPSSCGSCTRTLTTSGLTNGQVGDTITLPPAGSWFGGPSSSGPIYSANTPSDSPQVTANLRTNQNLPP